MTWELPTIGHSGYTVPMDTNTTTKNPTTDHGTVVRHNCTSTTEAIRLANIAEQAGELIQSITGSVILNIRDEHGHIAEVCMYDHTDRAYIRDGRTGWTVTVELFEDEDECELFWLVIDHDMTDD